MSSFTKKWFVLVECMLNFSAMHYCGVQYTWKIIHLEQAHFSTVWNPKRIQKTFVSRSHCLFFAIFIYIFWGLRVIIVLFVRFFTYIKISFFISCLVYKKVNKEQHDKILYIVKCAPKECLGKRKKKVCILRTFC